MNKLSWRKLPKELWFVCVGSDARPIAVYQSPETMEGNALRYGRRPSHKVYKATITYEEVV